MGLVCSFLGYYFLGNVIYSRKQRNNKSGIQYIAIGVIIEVIAPFLGYCKLQLQNLWLNKVLYYLFNGWFSSLFFWWLFLFLVVFHC